MRYAITLLAAVLALGGCDAEDPDTAPSSTVDRNPQTDQDPTPQTGTGGEFPPEAETPANRP